MKKIIIAASIILFGATSFATETKKACVEQKDAKTQKTKEVCKEIKVHKKLEVASAPKAPASKASAAK
jgi:hypothetical protein